ncbi:MAG: AraC family transcriptional regulator [Bacteroidales bacterium]|nr:AraC family transcriptional regulator [Bacteroidales bacterium]
MKHKLPVHKLLRIAALSMMPLLTLCDFLADGIPHPSMLCVNLWYALQLLILYPLPHEETLPGAAACVSAAGIALLLKLLAAPQWLMLMSGAFWVFLFSVHRSVHRFSDIPPLFMVSTVWPGTLDYLELFHTAAYQFMALGVLSLTPYVAGSWIMMGLLALFFGLHYYRIYTRSTLFLGSRKEKTIKQGQKGSGYKQPVQYVDSESRSAILFNEVVKIMEVRKPYLQEDFVLEDLARMTRTNRLYLSKSINFHSGRNFNQLVNYYRVKYAVVLMKKDPGLKMSEIASMSGFHTTVSFNMAFKLNEHTTPSEFVRSLKKLT